MRFQMGSDRDPASSRILTLGDSQFTWMQLEGQGSASGHVRIKFH
jgi:hypothetical protein